MLNSSISRDFPRSFFQMNHRLATKERPFREIGEKSAKSSRDIPEATALAVVGEDQAGTPQSYGP